jgi:hypothetical protein
MIGSFAFGFGWSHERLFCPDYTVLWMLPDS